MFFLSTMLLRCRVCDFTIQMRIVFFVWLSPFAIALRLLSGYQSDCLLESVIPVGEIFSFQSSILGFVDVNVTSKVFRKNPFWF